MKRLEIIHLRLAGVLPSGLLAELRRSATTAGDPASVDLYCRVDVEDDVAIHLRLNPAGPGDPASDLGLRLAAALREYGMVEHTVWRDAIPAGQAREEGEGEGHGEQ